MSAMCGIESRRMPTRHSAPSGRDFLAISITQGDALGCRISPRWGLDTKRPNRAKCDSPGWNPGFLESGFESRDLAALRDTLLPKLLSGEVGVAEVEGRLANMMP